MHTVSAFAADVLTRSPTCVWMHTGGTKTWLATDDTFLAENFAPGVSAFYGLYFTEKSGATQEYLDQQDSMLASGMNAEQLSGGTGRCGAGTLMLACCGCGTWRSTRACTSAHRRRWPPYW
jgi:hypothetical protein